MGATKEKNVLQRINDVMKELKFINKTQRVTGGGSYMAVTHDEVAKKVHPAMARHGLVAIPYLVNDKLEPSGMVTSNGNTIFLYQCVYDVNFYAIDDMEHFVTARVSAHANDMSDKAAGKAASYAMKYAYLKVFVLETGEEEEERVEGNVAPITEDQVTKLTDLCTELGFPEKETLNNLAHKVYKLGDIKELGSNLFDNAMKRLKKKSADSTRAGKKTGKKTAPKKTEGKKKADKKSGSKKQQTESDEPDPFGDDKGEE